MWPLMLPASRDPILYLREDRKSYGVNGVGAVKEVESLPPSSQCRAQDSFGERKIVRSDEFGVLTQFFDQSDFIAIRKFHTFHTVGPDFMREHCFIHPLKAQLLEKFGFIGEGKNSLHPQKP